jgi:hypothetical protein
MGIGSTGAPGVGAPGFWLLNSRWTRACLDALRLISRRPTRSPLLKFPLPCLNSQSAVSGFPVWKTSLTAHNIRIRRKLRCIEDGAREPLWNPYIFNCRTKDEIFVCLKY